MPYISNLSQSHKIQGSVARWNKHAFQVLKQGQDILQVTSGHSERPQSSNSSVAGHRCSFHRLCKEASILSWLQTLPWHSVQSRERVNMLTSALLSPGQWLLELSLDPHSVHRHLLFPVNLQAMINQILLFMQSSLAEHAVDFPLETKGAVKDLTRDRGEGRQGPVRHHGGCSSELCLYQEALYSWVKETHKTKWGSLMSPIYCKYEQVYRASRITRLSWVELWLELSIFWNVSPSRAFVFQPQITYYARFFRFGETLGCRIHLVLSEVLV